VRASVPGKAGDGLGSDFEQATLLLAVPSSLIDGIGPVYFEALGTIGSDFERRRVLTALATRQGVSAATLASTVQATRSIGSDFEHAEVLIAMANAQRLDGGLKDAALASAQGISSDFERARAIAALTRTTSARR
jgi:hypothetical protein